MKIKFVPLVIGFAVLSVMLHSCKQDTACSTYWEAEYTNPAFIVEVDAENSAMSMQIANIAPGGIAGEIFQSYFDGDFNVVAGFSNFVAPPQSGSNGRAYVEMLMYNSNTPDTIQDTNIVRAGISSNSIYTSIGFLKTEKSKLGVTNSGTFRIQKVGSSIVGQVVAGGDTVTVQATSTFQPLRFGFRMGSMNDSTVTGTTAIKITQFSVSGTTGATLYSDEFKCNSIYTP